MTPGAGAVRLVAAAVTALLISGCAAPTTQSPGVAARPAEAELAEPLRADLQTRLDAHRAGHGYPGAMVGVWAPSGAWVGVTGSAGRGSDRPPARGDHTRIGSVTKTFTVMALLQLVDRQQVALADTIGTYIPGLPNGDTATLRDLARMTSGIPSYNDNLDFDRAWAADPAGGVFTPEQLVDFARTQPALFPAGSDYHYSNTNTVLLGMVIEKVTGRPVAEVFRSNLLEPLGLSGTSFAGQSPDLPEPHLEGITDQPGEGFEALGIPVPPGGPIRDATNWNPSWEFTAGAMISTLDDLRTWAQALVSGGGLVSADIQREREASVGTELGRLDPDDPTATYGLGFFSIRGWWGHDGSVPGYTTYVAHHPQRQTSLVVFVNSDIRTPDQPAGPAVSLAEDIQFALDG